tara:strand:+ start:282 stop:1409 length:1128 start_codon:yes stop_codon:yes gene_type:complete
MKYILAFVFVGIYYLISNPGVLNDLGLGSISNYLNFSSGEPKTFKEAKYVVKKVYAGNEKTFYCGCDYKYVGDTGGRVDLDSCGYKIRPNRNGEISDATILRAQRIEYEHVFPASWYGYQLDCWKKGGRKNCGNDERFNLMESDVINLVPSIGQVNGDRSNYGFYEISRKSYQYGACDVYVDFKNKSVGPPENVRGEIARIMFYMHDAYRVDMRDGDEIMYMEWDKRYPVTEWEITRNNRIKEEVGYDNPFVSGEKKWVRNFKETGHRLKESNEDKKLNKNTESKEVGKEKNIKKEKQKVNSESKDLKEVDESVGVDEEGSIDFYKGTVYADKGTGNYFYEGCDGYNNINKTNLVIYKGEVMAIENGYQVSENCY